LFCPTEEAVDIEQKVTEDFMRFWFEMRSMAVDVTGRE
jgi:hypothetical protein